MDAVTVPPSSAPDSPSEDIVAAQTAPYFSIVVGYDFGDAGGFAFEEAARLSRRIKGSHVHLVHAFESEPDEKTAVDLAGRLRLYAEDKAAFVGGLGGSTVGIHLRAGAPKDVLRQFAIDVSADVIIVGAKKSRQIKEALFGGVAEALLEVARCPVLVAGPKPPDVPRQKFMELACSECVRARSMSGGTEWWCENHASQARTTHAYSYSRELPLAMHDSTVTPTGV